MTAKLDGKIKEFIFSFLNVKSHFLWVNTVLCNIENTDNSDNNNDVF